MKEKSQPLIYLWLKNQRIWSDVLLGRDGYHCSQYAGIFTGHETGLDCPREDPPGWIYHGDGVDKVQVFKNLGMNALIIHAGDG